MAIYKNQASQVDTPVEEIDQDYIFGQGLSIKFSNDLKLDSQLGSIGHWVIELENYHEPGNMNHFLRRKHLKS